MLFFICCYLQAYAWYKEDVLEYEHLFLHIKNDFFKLFFKK